MAINPQAPGSVVMIRPHHFCPNPDTAQDNKFQQDMKQSSANEIKQRAFAQVSKMQEILNQWGINVHLFDDEGDETPDSVFPNNWFSTHAGGHVAIYPMYAANRRKERRHDIIDLLKKQYRVQDIVDYSGLEYDGIYLEGTGAMVLDHIERVAYAAKSKRTDSMALERFCSHFNFEPMLFDACDGSGDPVYHTNVLMCIGTEYAMAGFELMNHSARRAEIIKRFENSGREIIELSETQINHFCGNALELESPKGRILALSETAFEVLTRTQIDILQKSVQLVPIDVSAIEMAGGSVRCMLAGIHLSKR